ncbi:hypothetical protein M8745_20465, partial [Lutimaribacter sp. EGI FJ00014]|nr:hypothetical protein [Lutimaribacter sp. EGI FJ00014]
MSEDLNRLEAQLGCAIVVQAVETGLADLVGGDFKLRLNRGEAAAICALSVEDRWAIRLGEALDGAQRGTPRLRLDVPVTVNLWRGVTTIFLADLRSLRPGDVIVPEELNHTQDTAIAIFADRFVVPVQATSDGWLLTAGVRPLAATKWEWIMDHSKQP